MAFGGISGSPGGVPTPSQLAENIAAVDKLPIQGFVFNLTNAKAYFADACMIPSFIYTYEDFVKEVALMKNFEFKSRKKFFARINISAGLQTDWFDDAGWKIILNNIKLASRASAEMGAFGFCLDNEQYNVQPFNYTSQSNRITKSFSEYEAQSRKRGKQFAEALLSHMPKAVLIYMFGNSQIASEKCEKSDLNTFYMGLWPGFLDGMMDATDEAKFIDGQENYNVRTFEHFSKNRRFVKKDGAIYSANPTRYQKRVHAASSVWLKKEVGDELSLDRADFTKNNHTPEEFEHAIHYALLNSDGWIWLYAVPWFNLPKEYIDAVHAARKPHKLDYNFPNAAQIKTREQTPPDQRGNAVATSKGRADCNDVLVFEAMRKVYKEIYDFPKQWKFSLDPDNVGIEKGWYKKIDVKDWIDLEIGDWYGCQLNSKYSGYTWYQTTFMAPKDWAGKKLLLAFGAVDEKAWLWLNGEEVGKSTAGPSAWNSAFEIDISNDIQPGKENMLSVRVHNSMGPGGIWKSVKIFAP